MRILFRIGEGIYNWWKLGGQEGAMLYLAGLYIVLSLLAFRFWFRHKDCVKQ